MGGKNKFFRNKILSSLPYGADNSNETSGLICDNIFLRVEMLSYNGN